MVVALHWIIQPLSPLFKKLGIWEVRNFFAYGVDLFFVISGFLIGGILLRIGQRLSGIRSFYIRRILRIWPLYYLLLGLVYLFAREGEVFFQIPCWSFFLFLFNFWESNHYRLHQAFGPLWSIAIEEQFYALGPLIFLMLNRKNLTRLTTAYLLLAPVLRMTLADHTRLDLWRFTPVRLDGICMGVLLALILSSREIVSYLSSKIKVLKVLAFFLFAFAIPMAIFSSGIANAFAPSLVVLAFGGLLLTVQVQCLSNQSLPILHTPFLRYLGQRCYFIYLFHILFRMLAWTFITDFIAALIVQSLLTLACAHISWTYLETPLINFGQRFSYE